MNWQDVIRRLPKAPIWLVICMDTGGAWSFFYEPQPAEVARKKGVLLADGIRKFRRGRAGNSVTLH